MGIDLQLAAGPGFELWEDHAAALAAFLAVSNQWRVVAGGLGGAIWLGLDYGAAEAGLRLSGARIDAGMWAELRMIEAGALEELNRKR